MEQCYNRIDSGCVECLLACLFRLDLVAFVRQRNSPYASDFSTRHCLDSANGSRYHVCITVSICFDDVFTAALSHHVHFNVIPYRESALADPASAIFLTGYPYLVVIINLPQRFQIVNSDTPVMAGVHLLPLLCSMALGKLEIYRLWRVYI